MAAVPILGISCDLEGINPVVVQGRDGNARARQQRIVIDVDVAVFIRYVDIIGLDVALRMPAEGDISVGRGIVGDIEHAILAMVVAIQRDGGLSNHSGLYIDGRIAGEQQFLSAYGGNAGDRQAHLLLEQSDGILSGAAVIARGATGEVIQLPEPILQQLHAAVFVAALEQDVAGRFGGIVGKQRALHGAGGLARLRQPRHALEHANGFSGFGGIGTALVGIQIIQFPQAVVQFAHAIAGIPLIQVDIAGALVCAVGVEGDQRIARGAFGNRQAIFRLEQLHSLLSAAAKDAVSGISQIAQIAQALLHDLHAQTAAAPGQRNIGIIGAERTGEDDALKFFIGDAGDLAVQIGLQQAHSILRAGTKDAVHDVIVIAQILQRLLNGAHRIAAAASGKGRILLRGLQSIPGGFLAFDGQAFQQDQALWRRFSFRFKFDEREIGNGFFLFQHRIHVQLAAHAIDGQAAHGISLREFIAGQIREAAEQVHNALLQIHGIDLVGRAQHEQRAVRGGQLAFHIHLGGEHNLPRHGFRIVALQSDGAARMRQIIDVVVQAGKGEDAGIDVFLRVVAQAIHVQIAVAGEIELICIGEDAFLGDFPGERLKGLRLLDVDHSACIVNQLKDQTLGGEIQLVDGLNGGIGGFHCLRAEIHAH